MEVKNKTNCNSPHVKNKVGPGKLMEQDGLFETESRCHKITQKSWINWKTNKSEVMMHRWEKISYYFYS